MRWKRWRFWKQRRRRDIFVKPDFQNESSSVGAKYAAPTELEILSGGSSAKISHLRRLSQTGFERIKNGVNLRTLHAGETFQKILDGLACLEVGEEALHRHTRAFEDQRAAEDFRVGMVSVFFAHGGTIRPFNFLGKTCG